MYLRIRDKSIRYRISKDETDQLLNNEVIVDELDLTNHFNLSYSIVMVNRKSNFKDME